MNRTQSKSVVVATLLVASLAALPVGAVAKSIFKDPRGWARDFARAAEVDAENLHERAKRDVRNTVRWIREDSCDRIKRKEGEVAYRRCVTSAQERPHSRSAAPGAYPARTDYAIIEVVCVRQGNGERYGTTTVSHRVRGTRQDAMRSLDQYYRTTNVCNTNFQRTDLRDLPYRWVHL